MYRDLSKHLGADQPCYALQSYRLGGPSPAFRRVEDAAASHIEEILRVQPDGAYYLCGSSFGGLIAFEIAQQLTARGREVAVVAMFDSYGVGYPRLLPTTSRARWEVYRFVSRIELHARNLLTADLKSNARYIRVKGTILGRRIAARTRMTLQSLRDPLPRTPTRGRSGECRGAARVSTQALPGSDRPVPRVQTAVGYSSGSDARLGWDGGEGSGDLRSPWLSRRDHSGTTCGRPRRAIEGMPRRTSLMIASAGSRIIDVLLAAAVRSDRGRSARRRSGQRAIGSAPRGYAGGGARPPRSSVIHDRVALVGANGAAFLAAFFAATHAHDVRPAQSCVYRRGVRALPDAILTPTP